MKKLLAFLFVVLIIVSSAYGTDLKYLVIKGSHVLNLLAGTTETLEAFGAYNTKDFKEYTSKDDPPIWSTSNLLINISEKGGFYCKNSGTVNVFATKGGRSDFIILNITTDASQARPEPPSGITATNITSNSATITWDDSKVRGTQYILKIGLDETAEQGGIPYMVEKPYILTWNIPRTGKLRSKTAYYIKMQSMNEYGSSGWSKPVKIETLQ